MRSRSPKSTGSDPYVVALRLLTRRDYSRAELTARLQQRGFSDTQIIPAVQRCNELGYLNDERYALERARALLRSGRAVGSRLVADLRQRGIPTEMAEEAASEAAQEFDQESLFEQLLEQRFAGFSFRQASDRDKQRVVNYFRRRGFDLSLILNRLRKER